MAVLRPLMPHALEILVQDEGNLLARGGNVLFQIRTGQMTQSVLDRFESAVRLMRVSSGGRVGALVVVEDGAGLAPAPLRRRQADLIRVLLGTERTCCVAVILGDSIPTRAVRTVMRLLLRGTPRLFTARTVREGAVRLADEMDGELGASELLRLAERARELARRP